MQTYKITVYDNGEEFRYFMDAKNEEEAGEIADEDYPNAQAIFIEEVKS